MIDQLSLRQFNAIYEQTYHTVLRYIVCKASNMSDVNDLIQETYLELYKILKKKTLSSENVTSFVIGIAYYKIKKHQSLLYKWKELPLFCKEDDDFGLIDQLKNDIDIENQVIAQEQWDAIWKALTNLKNQDIARIFYFYYKEEYAIKEIAQQLGKSESYIKHCLYRTLEKLNQKFGKEMLEDERK